MTLAARALAVAGAAVLLGVPGTALAASGDDAPAGYDVSHPQCGERLPQRASFAVVGVNGGIATRANPCLADQLEWATEATGTHRATGADGATGGDAVELYVNTANPGEVIDRITTWPVTGSTPYGTCDGSNSAACSWQYGWTRAAAAVRVFTSAARDADVDDDPAAYRWWLDVETENTWQAGSPGSRARNRAVLEGMVTQLQDGGAEVGLYSSDRQWAAIAGEVPARSLLHDLDSWLAGADGAHEAAADCAEDPLGPGGRVVLTQYTDDGLGRDVAC